MCIRQYSEEAFWRFWLFHDYSFRAVNVVINFFIRFVRVYDAHYFNGVLVHKEEIGGNG